MRGPFCRFVISLIVVGMGSCMAQLARADTGGEWVKLARMDLPRQECGAARIGDKVYVVGGLIAGFRATNSVEVYDIDDDEWSPVASLPQPRDHMGVAAFDGKLYSIGGYNADFAAKREVYRYDPQVNEWNTVAPLPEARGACWAVTHRDKIYVFGGNDPNGIARTTTFIYDPVANLWTTGRDMPTAREHLTATAAGDFIYVIGGRRGGAFNVNERYDPANNEWATMAPMPTARSAMGVATFGRRIIVAGGEVPRLFEVNEVYDIVSNTWDCYADMPVPRHGLAAVTLDDRLLMPAGGTIQGLQPSNYVDSFIPPPATNGDINEITVLSGTLLSGGLTSIYESDDVALVTEARVTGEVHQPHLLEILFAAASDVQSPQTIDITFEARISDVEATTWLFLHNWRNGRTVQVAQFTNGLEETVEMVNVTNAGRFVRSSDGRIELLLRQIVFFPFTLNGFHSFIDQVQMTVR